jgi:general secretion pathway protein J
MAASNRFGFTLLELLVALAAASLIILAVSTTLFSLNRAYETAAIGMEQQRSLRTTLDLLRKELSATLYQRADKLLRFQVEDRDYYGKPASILSFTTLAPPLEGEVSDQIRVQYKPEETDQGISLTRASRDFFQLDTTPVQAYPVIDSLEGFLVECYDGSTWVKGWDTALANRLPRQVRITVYLPDNDKTVSYQVIATPRINAQ